MERSQIFEKFWNSTWIKKRTTVKLLTKKFPKIPEIVEMRNLGEKSRFNTI